MYDMTKSGPAKYQNTYSIAYLKYHRDRKHSKNRMRNKRILRTSYVRVHSIAEEAAPRLVTVRVATALWHFWFPQPIVNICDAMT